jgi:hypothetical protein
LKLETLSSEVTPAEGSTAVHSAASHWFNNFIAHEFDDFVNGES